MKYLYRVWVVIASLSFPFMVILAFPIAGWRLIRTGDGDFEDVINDWWDWHTRQLEKCRDD